jgi:hypothetical protein
MSKFQETLSNLRQLPEWVWGHAFARIQDLSANSDGTLIHADTPAEPTEANLITSRALDQEGTLDGTIKRWGEEIHRPLLDIDFEAALIPSSSPGKFHLYLDKPMPRSTYNALLRALADAGVIERGFADSGMGSELGTTLRLPWVKKEDPNATQDPLPF